MSEVVITPAELAALRERGPVHILDVRWRLDRPDGRPEYLAGHLPGAVYVDLDHELAAHGAPTDGRHPLPDAGELQAAARRWGLRDGEPVVVYDDLKSLSAARAWWLLTDAGIETRILDGSLRGWTDAGLPLEQGEVTPVAGDVTLQPGRLPRIDIDEAAAFPDSGVLLDARAAERYRGDTEPIDPRAGHIPGARNIPTPSLVDDHGRFLDRDTLLARFAAAGITDDVPVAVYCGSGVTASHEIAALTLAGFAPALYPGSWSQWANHTDRPVATGDQPTTEALTGSEIPA